MDAQVTRTLAGTPNMPVSTSDPFAEGWEAAEAGKSRYDNPYRLDTAGLVAYMLWDKGYVARTKA